MDWNTFGVCFVAFLSGIAVLWLAAVAIKRHRRVTRGALFAALAFATVAAVQAQKRGVPPMRNGAASVAVTPEEVAKGFRLVSETTDAGHSFAIPSNAATVGNWHLRGAFRDWLRLDLDGLAFPSVTNDLTALSAFADGRLRPVPRDTTHEICAVGAPMLALQGESRFWIAAEPDGSRVVTWENFFLDADTNAPVNAQVVLRPDGGFTVRSNDVVRAFERIHPSDWDGDGIPNALDAEPLVRNGDFHGPGNALPPGASPGAFRTVAIASRGAAVAEIVFSGDGPSDYPDPHFMARPHSTNEVAILAGKFYTIESDRPVECVWKDDEATVVGTNSPTSLTAHRPVVVSCASSGPVRGGSEARRNAPLRSSPEDFFVTVDPTGLGGLVSWSSNTCCEVVGSGLAFAYACGSCGCGRCRAKGHYEYVGYTIPVTAPPCPCVSDPAGGEGEPENPPACGGASVSFSDSVIFYEEAYANAPGDSVGRRVPKNVRLTCTVDGGPRGGVFSFTKDGFDRLSLVSGIEPPATSIELAPGEAREWEATYAPLSHSAAEDDIKAEARFAENLSGGVYGNEAKMTVVQLELEPVVKKNGFKHRHLVGVAEMIRCSAKPSIGSFGTSGGGELRNWEHDELYQCPLTSDGSTLYYTANSSRYDFALTIVEPSMLVARSPVPIDFNIGENRAGGVGMQFEIYVLPETVSFSGIAMEEIPSTEGVHRGYYENVYFADDWYHTYDRGAGRWANIGRNNYWGPDMPCTGQEEPRELPDGSMTTNPNEGTWREGLLIWNINWGWAESNRSDGDVHVEAMETPYDQEFRMDEFGTHSITKFQHTVIRGTNGVVRSLFSTEQ